jgi:CBS domain-containing protein
MIAGELIAQGFPFLTPEDTVEHARQLFMDTCVCHLAVVSPEKIEGILPADVVWSSDEDDLPVQSFRDDFIHAAATSDMHGLGVFEIVSQMELSVLPVADEHFQYVGTVTTEDLLYRLGSYHSFRQPGGIIRLSVGIKDYNLSEIARIVETNNAKVILLYMDIDEGAGLYHITIKVNTLDISRLVATFERFKYAIAYHFPADMRRDEMQERYDFLMKLFDL